jgi:hypothetical protein
MFCRLFFGSFLDVLTPLQKICIEGRRRIGELNFRSACLYPVPERDPSLPRLPFLFRRSRRRAAIICFFENNNNNTIGRIKLLLGSKAGLFTT